MKIRPEVKDVKYWLHLVLISFLVLEMANFFYNPTLMVITIRLVLETAVLIGIADVTVHTILKLD